jgi:hypothetical protein
MGFENVSPSPTGGNVCYRSLIDFCGLLLESCVIMGKDTSNNNVMLAIYVWGFWVMPYACNICLIKIICKKCLIKIIGFSWFAHFLLMKWNCSFKICASLVIFLGSISFIIIVFLCFFERNAPGSPYKIFFLKNKNLNLYPWELKPRWLDCTSTSITKWARYLGGMINIHVFATLHSRRKIHVFQCSWM